MKIRELLIFLLHCKVSLGLKINLFSYISIFIPKFLKCWNFIRRISCDLFNNDGWISQTNILLSLECFTLENFPCFAIRKRNRIYRYRKRNRKFNRLNSVMLFFSVKCFTNNLIKMLLYDLCYVCNDSILMHKSCYFYQFAL